MSTTTDTHGSKSKGWIGVDLDGTLAYYNGWKGVENIGAPIPLMVSRVREWLANDQPIRIMTARVSPQRDESARQQAIDYIRVWLVQVFGDAGHSIPITHEKDFSMIELWDDRCVQVIPNTGERADGEL
jgi:hypothetical protein